MIFRQLFDRESSTYTYLLADEKTKEALLVDPVRDQVERDQHLLDELGLKLVYTLETHVHADHIAGSGVLRQRHGSRSVMSKSAGATCADVLVGDGDVIRMGGILVEARLTPGHTDGCVSYVVHDAGMVFTGDTLLIRGCGRTDFQQGSSHTLYHSVTQKLFSLPDHYAVYPGHDYKGRTMSTIAEEKELNPRLGGKSEAEFVEIMANLKLAQPKKIAIAVPANLECGLPTAESHASEPAAERGWAPIERSASGVAEVSAAWTKEHLGELRIIDVRELDEYDGAMGHIEGAELVPLGTVSHTVAEWDRDAAYVVVCRGGGRSGRAAKAMEAMGFKRVVSMRGGMLVWRQLDEGVAATAPASCG